MELLMLPPVLAGADRLFGEPGLVEVFRPYFSSDRGRWSIPMDTYVRMMFLKRRLGVGYERLCVEVAGSVTYRLFCGIGLTGLVPHHSTLKSITTRCGPDAVAGLNDVVVRAAAAGGDLDVSRVRVDTTFVDANIRHPRDSSLLGEAIRKLVARSELLIDCLDLDNMAIDAGAVGELARWGRSRHADRVDEILVITDQIADLAASAAVQAAAVLTAARRVLAGGGWAPKGTRRAVNVLVKVLGVIDRPVHQATERARHRHVPAGDKRVSLHDTDARPMRKGTTKHKGTQFAYTGEITEDNGGVIVDYEIHIGQPPDADLIGPAIQRVTDRVGQTPAAVTADGTFGTAAARHDLTQTGVECVAIKALGIPDPGQTELETSDEFTTCRRWRAGIEARISHLKRDYQWDRARMSNLPGARTWLGWGVFAHNITKLALRT
ncbi:MAG: transposase [Acidimicrobiales bacterium]